ncbi:hypothetical protein Nepgr_032225 [Nepenthes gracilis]|uniref:Uncharacterized protein n=1 Tax=Nepenthes gracilis TaxID=150966 RepID=A0AAD3TJ24_NEPGR|nr:hypothetical protein Nepgr_032225 [Nepenthes gracilis]
MLGVALLLEADGGNAKTGSWRLADAARCGWLAEIAGIAGKSFCRICGLLDSATVKTEVFIALQPRWSFAEMLQVPRYISQPSTMQNAPPKASLPSAYTNGSPSYFIKAHSSKCTPNALSRIPISGNLQNLDRTPPRPKHHLGQCSHRSNNNLVGF